jgi:hypothetical protein
MQTQPSIVFVHGLWADSGPAILVGHSYHRDVAAVQLLSHAGWRGWLLAPVIRVSL